MRSPALSWTTRSCDRVALGGGVLGVAADVEVEAGAVLEEHVARAAPRHDPAEQVAGDLVGAEPALAAQGAGDAVLVLEPEDPALHACSGDGCDGRLPGSAGLARSARRPRGAMPVCGPTVVRCVPTVGADDADSPRCTARSAAQVLLARLADEGIDARAAGRGRRPLRLHRRRHGPGRRVRPRGPARRRAATCCSPTRSTDATTLPEPAIRPSFHAIAWSWPAGAGRDRGRPRSRRSRTTLGS